MTGLCGWFGMQGLVPEASTVLPRMLDRIPALPGSAIQQAAGEFGALACHGRPGPPAASLVDGLAVACAGRVRWEDESLARTAAERGDAQALGEAFRRFGSDLLTRARGAFALAVYDPRERRGLLAVDRIGVNSLCYATSDSGLVFGATADSVIEHPAVPARVSQQAIYNYLYCHVVPAPGTIYAGVQKLLPGQCLHFANGRTQTRFYWTLQYEDADARRVEALAHEFRDLLNAAVARSVGTEDVGAFLSGGTDSSTVVGMLSEVRGRPVDTYSIGFEAEGFDEMDYARIAVRHFGARAHEIYVTPRDVADAIPRVAASYDEPFGNASAVPAYYCASAARSDGKTLMLAGDGGDEIFGGNARYAKQKVFEWYWGIPGGLRRALIEPVVLNAPGAERLPPLRKLGSYVRQARVPLPDRLETYNFLEREPIAQILSADFVRQVDCTQPADLAREVYHRTSSRSPVNRMMHLDMKQTLADNDLRKVNRMCLLAGIDVRYPLLDDDLVAFAGRLPPSLKVRGLSLRWFFKQALRDFLPPETIAKTKHGFGLPFGIWLDRHPPLQELSRASLLSLRQRGIVREAYIDRLVERQRSDHATYYGVMIWVLMMLEQWFQSHRLS